MARSRPAQLSVPVGSFGASPIGLFRSPAVRVLVVATLVAAPLVILSIVDAGGLRTTWDDLHWSVSAIGAAIATALSIRGTVGRARLVRIAGAVAFALWLLANLSWAWLDLSGHAVIPSLADVFVFAVLFPGSLLLVATVHGRLSRAEEAAVYLDSALILCFLATILLLGYGSRALALPTAAGVIALAYPTAFLGLGAAGLVALLAVRYPFAPRGSFALVGGSALIGLAYLGWVAPTVEGTPAGALPSVLFTVGTILAAYGAATWQDERRDTARCMAVSRFVSRAIGPTTAGLTFLALLPRVADSIGAFVDGVVFLAGALFVIRQALLLRERTLMLDEVTRLKLENDRLVGELLRELDERALDQRRMIQSSRAAAVGELAAGVAHEVNNPLQGVLGYAELLLENLDPNDPRRRDVDTIRSEALRARKIVRALGDFARPGSPELVATDVGDVIRRTIDLVRYPVERRGVTITEHYADLPLALVDPQAIQQAVLNIVTNALQAVAEAGHIEIDARLDDGWIRIVVADDGIGMEDTTVRKAFEPFFTGRVTADGAGLPTGLGLSVSRGLIESHGGTITLTSRPGRGTQVEIRLPLDRPATIDGDGLVGGAA